MTTKILKGNNLDTLKTLDDQSINTVVTSPPYWGLRDYGTGTWEGGDPDCPHMRTTKISINTATGHKGMADKGHAVGDAIYKDICPKCNAVRKDSQLGLEDTPEQFAHNLVMLFREIRRVLRDDGTVWLNLGDSYSSGGRRTTTNQSLRGDKDYGVTRPAPSEGIKPKDLIGIPWRVAFALQQDGWYLRQDIIWHKPNPMPESVTDRCTKAHEYIFLLSKSSKYYYDNEAIKEDLADSSVVRLSQQSLFEQEGSDRVPFKTNGKMKAVYSKSHGKYATKENEAAHRQGIHANRGENLVEVRNNLPKQKDLVSFLKKKTNAKKLAENTDIPLSKIEHWFRNDKSGFSYPTKEDWFKVREFIDDWSKEFNEIDTGLSSYELKTDEVLVSGKRNKRSVWTVTTKPFKGAHFATFPMDLIAPCVLAGCPEKICVDCGEPYVRELESVSVKRNELPKNDSRYRPNLYDGNYKDINGKGDAGYNQSKDLGFKKQCDCETNETKGGTVLDPFGGSSTTGIFASANNRNSIMCELNAEYIEIAKNRINKDLGMFANIEVL
tara:strand:+ start:190 stop:1845 length:1656 start_codon:yes stop_codon:yes gene_type:complete